jgi:hypothetical protein
VSDDAWQAELLELFAKLDHAETLHEDTMRFQATYATEDIGHFVAEHRSQLAAALAKVAELDEGNAVLATYCRTQWRVFGMEPESRGFSARCKELDAARLAAVEYLKKEGKDG